MRDLPTARPGATAHQQSVTLMYSDHHGWLHGWLWKKLGCSQRAADIAQDAFLRVLALADPGSIQQPRAFLATTANRLLIDGARRRRIESAYLEALALRSEDHAAHGPEAIHAAVDALERVFQMLQGLPAKPREAFLLSRLDGLAYVDIAARLGVSPSMVKQYIAKVLVHCYTTLHGAPGA
ncbi:sigma-70 family RNA polymerase sigma factor [Pseudomonas sp. NPDC007930]|uniref:sigma-70 family RNA polymerase sigma factor n=1 Tax=Pseudomonas sp. NPDC007930 TaxID=3364417 RepID=UPI0036ECFB35